MLIGAGAAALLAFGGIQTARLNHAKGDLTAARAALKIVPNSALRVRQVGDNGG